MVTKIFLGLAIACGIGAAVIGFLVVKPRIINAETERDQTKQQLASEQSSHSKTREELNTTKMTLDTTKAELDTTKNSLAQKTSEAEALAQDKSKLEGDKNNLQTQLATAKAENKRFTDFGKSMEEIEATFKKLPQVTKERDTYAAENKVLALEIKKRDNKILELTGGPAILPENLTGKVVAVDPKYQFVVLNVGMDHGAKVNGEMIVNRDGKFVGQVRITRAEKEYCYANIVQDKNNPADVSEGDVVLVSKYNNVQKKAQ